MPKVFSNVGQSVKQLMQQTALIVREERASGKRVFVVVDSVFRGEAIVRQLAKIEVQCTFLDAIDRQEAEILKQKFTAGEIGVIIGTLRHQAAIKADTLIACGCELDNADIIISGKQDNGRQEISMMRSAQATEPQSDKAQNVEQATRSFPNKSIPPPLKSKRNSVSRKFIMIFALVVLLAAVLRVANRT